MIEVRHAQDAEDSPLLLTDAVLPGVLRALSPLLPGARRSPPGGEQGELVLPPLQVLPRLWAQEQTLEGSEAWGSFTWAGALSVGACSSVRLTCDALTCCTHLLAAPLWSQTLSLFLICSLLCFSLCWSVRNVRTAITPPAWDPTTQNPTSARSLG